MKRIYMTAALLGTALTGAFAQRHCDLQLVAAAPSTATTINCKDSFTLGYIFVNKGPDMVMTSDTMRVLDGEAATGAVWVFAVTANKGIGDTVIAYVGKSHKNMTNTLLNAAGTAIVNAPFANGNYKYPIIFEGFTDTLAVKDTGMANNGVAADFIINCTTGIDELLGGTSKTNLNIYPNPASATEVRLKYDFNNENATVRVSDIAGRVLITKNYGKQSAGEKELTLDISSLQNGLYYVELIADDKHAISKLTVRK